MAVRRARLLERRERGADGRCRKPDDDHAHERRPDVREEHRIGEQGEIDQPERDRGQDEKAPRVEPRTARPITSAPARPPMACADSRLP
jgi:hypothetical protein